MKRHKLDLMTVLILVVALGVVITMTTQAGVMGGAGVRLAAQSAPVTVAQQDQRLR
jgi:hypothetical protein